LHGKQEVDVESFLPVEAEISVTKNKLQNALQHFISRLHFVPLKSGLLIRGMAFGGSGLILYYYCIRIYTYLMINQCEQRLVHVKKKKEYFITEANNLSEFY
jgi:hypothetical protein